MMHEAMPVLVGVGQVTDREPDLEKAASPLDLIEKAVRLAALDAGIADQALSALDALVIVRCFREPTRNSPEALARRLEAGQARQWLAPNGGSGPQSLVNMFFTQIARGERQFVLLAGAEAMDTSRKFYKAGKKPDWKEPASCDPEHIFPDLEMASEHEMAHGMLLPAHVYPLFENALRGYYGDSIEAHQQMLGELFAPFTEVAANSAYAWYPIRRTAAEIATPSPDNRWVGWPYTKRMNAMNQINQSAALLLCSAGYARRLGIDESRWIHLHGCADANDTPRVSERINFFSSPAIRTVADQTLKMAKLDIKEIDHLDLYSCFPCAVQIARDEFGISREDPRPLTVTGGLPFHGGAGNNYVMNSIAAMVEKLREAPGSYGLVTANGGYLTKHSAGVYSTRPVPELPGDIPWKREPPETYQAKLDALPFSRVETKPEGRGTVETWTLAFGRDGSPEMGIIIGRLGGDPRGPRFVAKTPADRELMESMTRTDMLGHSGKISQQGPINIFTPD